MNTRILKTGAFLLTFIAIALYPEVRDALAISPRPAVGLAQPPALQTSGQRPRIEAVFVLDTTGSMGGLIQAAKEKIWSIASSMAKGQPAPEIRIGLVAYRDRGDAYVTRVVDLSRDLDSLYANLMEFQADGGGDGPESVNQALADAVGKVSWSADAGVYKVIFLVGDAPPHRDYPDDPPYETTLGLARQRGILINTIQCGNDATATPDWRQIATLGQGQYFQVGQAGGAIALATPYDRKLAELSEQLDGTRLYYGSPAEQAAMRSKQDATARVHAAASDESRARRATFNASVSGRDSLIGKNELVEAVKSGKVALDRLAPATLPAPLRALAPAERQAKVAETAKQREVLEKEIDQVARQRSEYLRQQVETRGGAKDSLDAKIFSAVKEQAGTKGLAYPSAAPDY